ncbi:MAG: flagellar hook assembly protein FlgD [Syntrophales bacterium]|jgi:flagellar basal-body rod modification protein FlgD|nr:flagellar hook assembly protein FlgD [Syntrophales bacterium]MDY0043105.1 flagellar hook assembly protein FlgD [Syntrophales bacterium]
MSATISGVTAGSSAPFQGDNAVNAMGKDEFLRLLITQLKNQDPLKPMDGTDFTSQLAQFSSLEQLYNISEGVNTFNSSQHIMNNMKSIDLIGKQVKVQGNELNVNGGEVDITYYLEEDAMKGNIEVTDANGKVVKRFDLAAEEEGEHTIRWDCSGISEGKYSFQVTAENAEGDSINTKTFLKGAVSGITFKEDKVCIDIGGSEIPFESIVSVVDGA